MKKSQILSNFISNNIYNNLHHFDNDVIVQVDNGNTKANRSNVHETSIEVKSFKQKEKKFHLLWNYFMVCHSLIFLVPCVSKRFYSNLISKSRSHLIFTVKLSFYVLFLGLIFRNYLLSPKLNHGFSGENTTFSKISYKYTHHTKHLPLEVYILSTSNFNRIDLSNIKLHWNTLFNQIISHSLTMTMSSLSTL